MDQTPDYYTLLHVQPDAPVEIIRASYRTLMQKLKAHPDMGGDHVQAALINEAYATLTSAEARHRYDTSRRRATDGQPKRANRVGSADICPFCQIDLKGEVGESCPSCEAPLTRPGYGGAENDDRQINRLARCQALTLVPHKGARAITACSRDLSPLGMLVETHEQLPVGQIFLLTSEHLKAVARVVRTDCSGRTHLAGLEFLTLQFLKTQGAFIAIRA